MSQPYGPSSSVDMGRCWYPSACHCCFAPPWRRRTRKVLPPVLVWALIDESNGRVGTGPPSPHGSWNIGTYIGKAVTSSWCRCLIEYLKSCMTPISIADICMCTSLFQFKIDRTKKKVDMQCQTTPVNWFLIQCNGLGKTMFLLYCYMVRWYQETSIKRYWYLAKLLMDFSVQ